MALEIYSPSFSHGQLIPEEFTCDGADISPPIGWKQIPKETKSLALIMDDPDAPVGLWVHWVVYNIPPLIDSLPQNVSKKGVVEIQGHKITQGKNSWNRIGYGGPCPPDKEHRYFFKIYALSQETNFPTGLTAKELEQKISSIILEKAELMGRYDLKKRRKR
ncbi:MAG: YbhB/YbcL family Raf kinase inhibitor-like protein [Leptospiraceae bacterium]|nr:YbhB/YbcL family Raf kinase inhibitor-like protein [Leptospiraceae bacterium]MDW7976819.1 YbhB/YbcL family Raf kinase inhibitor-like protein [Leptospiraceae bacterium]